MSDRTLSISFEQVAEMAGRLERELAKSIVGQQRVIREILIAFLAGGHCYLRASMNAKQRSFRLLREGS